MPEIAHESTRDRIVKVAARLFRERGYAGTGVDAVMRAAGLTHGGFYALFGNKAGLFADAVRVALAENRRRIRSAGRGRTGRAWLRAMAELYLSEAHVTEIGVGCTLPALANDVARGDDAVRASFQAGLEEIVGDMVAAAPSDPAAEERAWATLATLAGGLAIARAVADPALRDRIVAAVARAVDRVNDADVGNNARARVDR